MRILFPLCFILIQGLLFVSCNEKPATESVIQFTKADSLTDFYLNLQDSLHQTWNIMIHDDNEKIIAMKSLLHELIVTHPEDHEKYASLEERLEQLTRLRYTQKSMANAHVIEEYDFASNSLVIELIADAESNKEFEYNSTLRKLVDHILLADQRVNNYRFAYDSIASVYNHFLEQHHSHLIEIDHDLKLEKKPQFGLAEGE